MASLPPAIFFINGDITYPPVPPPTPDVYIGAQPNLPNSDASVSELTNLQIQLFIDDTITKQEFDARIAADPNYPTIVHLQGFRVLVIVPLYNDGYHYGRVHNSQFADVILFLHKGLADVERNRFWDFDDFDDHDGYRQHKHHHHKIGQPGHSYDIQRLNVYTLLRAAHSCDSVFLPFEAMPHCNSCNFHFYCDRCHTFSGIRICRGCKCDCKCGCFLIDNQGVRSSPVHLPNCDNEYHNRNFIHRK